jgi:hypothetical protein
MAIKGFKGSAVGKYMQFKTPIFDVKIWEGKAARLVLRITWPRW